MKQRLKKICAGLLAVALALPLLHMPVSATESMQSENLPMIDANGMVVELNEGEKEVTEDIEISEDLAIGLAASIPSDICNVDEWAMLYAINKLRIRYGEVPLSTCSKLQTIADTRETEITYKFSTTRPNGTNVGALLDQLGIDWDYSQEIIVRGGSGVVDTFSYLCEDLTDLQIMLSNDFTHLGVGFDYRYSKYYGNGNYTAMTFMGTCTPTSIRVLGDAQVCYLEANGSDLLDEHLMSVEVTCKHGTHYMPLIEEMCTGLNKSNTSSVQTVTVRYGGKTDTIKVKMVKPTSFKDLSYTDWYYYDVRTIYERGIMNGFNATTFGPMYGLTRSQFAKILHNMNGNPYVSYYPIFRDVKQNAWYASSVLWAQNKGIVTGYGNGNFGPDNPITREDMAVIMYRYANSKNCYTGNKANLYQFNDAYRVSGYAQEAMRWAVGTGIITGKYNGTMLDPQGTTTRAECAIIVNRFLNAYGF